MECLRYLKGRIDYKLVTRAKGVLVNGNVPYVVNYRSTAQEEMNRWGMSPKEVVPTQVYP